MGRENHPVRLTVVVILGSRLNSPSTRDVESISALLAGFRQFNLRNQPVGARQAVRVSGRQIGDPGSAKKKFVRSWNPRIAPPPPL